MNQEKVASNNISADRKERKYKKIREKSTCVRTATNWLPLCINKPISERNHTWHQSSEDIEGGMDTEAQS